jgi:predicted metal-dependent peptidase
MTSKKKEFDLNQHTARLLMDEPFFAALSRRIEKVPSSQIPTAGMRVDDDGNFTLLYNTEYFSDLTSEEMADVLKHEFYHIIFDHVTGRLPEKTVTKLWNFATDLAINSHLRNLPEGCLIPGEGLFEDFPKKLSAEKYHAMLKKKMKEEQESGDQGEGESLEDAEEWDSHEGWDSRTGENVQIAKERLKKILKDAVKEASSSGWGSLSQEIKEKILSNLDATLDWKKVLRYFIKTSQKSSKSSSVKRINRRYPYLHPGRRTDRQARVAVSVDQSGSVDNGMLAAFFAELAKLSQIATFTVIPFDTEVSEKDVFEWKKGQKYECKRFMTGGTDFDAPTEYVNERDFDGHIILTDMYAPKPKASRCQRMWMTTPRNLKNAYFETNERVVAINYDD